jgi:hypothetical protein
VPDIGLAAHDATQWACLSPGVFAVPGGLAADAAGTMTAVPIMSAIPPRTADSRRVPGVMAENDFTVALPIVEFPINGW